MLQTNPDRRIAAYAVWVPELGAQEGNVAQATALLPDDRVRQFWNPSESLGKQYGRILATSPEPAWDVYLVFDRGVKWKNVDPPRPGFWMQQLVAAQGKAPFLDGAVFANEVARLLSR